VRIDEITGDLEVATTDIKFVVLLLADMVRVISDQAREMLKV
jgi:hypothetical protein